MKSCRATITDSRSDAIEGSASVSIDNTLPVVEDGISPDEGVKADTTLTCSATGSMQIINLLNGAMSTNDGTELGTEAELTLTAESVDTGDTITAPPPQRTKVETVSQTRLASLSKTAFP